MLGWCVKWWTVGCIAVHLEQSAMVVPTVQLWRKEED